jgi:adenosylcobinamide-phosphate synthase
MAGLLGIQLGGDNVYSGQVVKKPTIGERTRKLENQDIKRAIEVMFRTEFVFLLTYMLIWIL